jgi:hypothetical protein
MNVIFVLGRLVVWLHDLHGSQISVWGQQTASQHVFLYGLHTKNGFYILIILLYFLELFLFYFIFGGIRICTEGFTLAKQVLYYLSNTSSPVCSGYFGDEGLSDLNCDPPLLSLPSS